MQHAVLGSALAIAIAACTSLSSQREHAIELDDVWTANGLPCAAEKVDVPLNLRKRSGQLTASSLAAKRCFAPGRVLWTAKLPAKPIVAADLPLTLAAELTIEDASAAGSLTLLSETRMILTTEHAVVEVTRGAELSGPAGGASAGSAGEPAEQGGAASEKAPQQPAAAGSEAGAGAKDAAPASAAGSGGRAVATPSAPAAGSGGAGSAAIPVAGASAGTPATQAGSAAPAAGSSAPAAAGSGVAAGTGGTGGAAEPTLPRNWKIEDLQTSYWFCVSIGPGCVCVDNTANRSYQDMCVVHPTGCCYVLLDEDQINCQCWFADNQMCVSEGQSPVALKVDNCPPR